MAELKAGQTWPNVKGTDALADLKKKNPNRGWPEDPKDEKAVGSQAFTDLTWNKGSANTTAQDTPYKEPMKKSTEKQTGPNAGPFPYSKDGDKPARKAGPSDPKDIRDEYMNKAPKEEMTEGKTSFTGSKYNIPRKSYPNRPAVDLTKPEKRGAVLGQKASTQDAEGNYYGEPKDEAAKKQEARRAAFRRRMEGIYDEEPAVDELDLSGQEVASPVNASAPPLPSVHDETLKALEYDSAEDHEQAEGLDTIQHSHTPPRERDIDTTRPAPRGLNESQRALWTRFLTNMYEAASGSAALIQAYLDSTSEPSYGGLEKYAAEQGVQTPSRVYFNRIRSANPANTAALETKEAVAAPFDVSKAPDELKALLDLYTQATEEEASVMPSVEQKYEGIYSIAYRTAKGRALKKHAFICGSPGIGKFQGNSNKVLTPTGWTTMGEIEVGDKVLTPSNEVALVSQKFPQGVQPLYKITLKDGTSTEAGLPHLWYVKDQNQKIQTLETGDLIEGLEAGKHYYLPFTSPLNFPKQELPIDPYALGLLLGDGGFTQGGITFTTVEESLKTALLDGLRKNFDVTLSPSRDPITLRLVSNPGDRVGRETRINQALRLLGLKKVTSATKKIPEIYLYGAIEDRLALLQGLMDTDGYVTSLGATQYTTISDELAQGFLTLVRGLGGRATLKNKPTSYTYLGEKKSGQNANTITFSLPIELGAPVRLPYKRERYDMNAQQVREWQSIVSIEFDRVEESSCIMVDHPSHLYITDDFIVTHNTYTVLRAVEKGATESKKEFAKYRGSIGKSLSDILAFLYIHKDGFVILLDDCDGFLTGSSADVINTLKAAMDTDEPMVSTGGPGMRRLVAKKVGLSDGMEEGVKPSLRIDISRLNEGVVAAYDKDDNLLREERIDAKEVAWYKTVFGLKRVETKRNTGHLGTFLAESIYGRVREALPVEVSDDELLEDPEEEELEDDVGDVATVDFPANFLFTSSIIFVSNMMQSEVPDAIASRCNVKELFLTLPEIMVRIEQILPQLLKNETAYTKEEIDWAKQNVFKWMSALVQAHELHAPVVTSSGQRVPVRVKVPITFRMFNDFVDGWMTLADEIGGNDFAALEKAVTLRFISQIVLPAFGGDARTKKKK
jgi:hypothetical protein